MRLFLLALLCVFPISAQACSCGEDRDVKSRFERAYAVVLAEVTDTELIKITYNDHDVEYIRANINVLEAFKDGKEPVTKVIDLVPGIGNCSIGLISGMEYVFFIDSDSESDSAETGNHEKLGTNNYVGICTGSHHVNMYHESFKTKAQELRTLKP